MATNLSGAYRDRAIGHEIRAHNYRRQADLMLERDGDSDCAAALLYESAKQCINALANQRGQNPATTGGKVNVLRTIATLETNGRELMRCWQSADKLHVHADRGHLITVEFNGYWNDAQSFIDSMLTIYARDA